MKNIKIIFNEAYLFAIACLFSATYSFAQPVIKVPPACEVVFAGTGSGATTGFGGAVGDGGIIVMPDPFDLPEGEGDFYYASNGSELIQWELFGDLSLQTDSDYNAAMQSTGAVNPVNLQSYNKKLRLTEMPSELQPLLDPKWARSKGRVIVSYNDKKCVGKIKFDVFKSYKYDKGKTQVPPILGADCLLPNTTYTFSVDPIASDNANDEIGFDKYYWSGLPEDSLNVYSAADNSSITFTTGTSVSDFTIKCCYGRANAWDGDAASPTHTTCVSKSIRGQAAAPVFSIAPATCLNTGLTSFSVTINPAFIVAGTNYTWSAPNANWSLVPGGTPSGQTLAVNGMDNNPGTLILTVTNGSCLPAVFTYPVNRNYNSSFAIAGINCVSAGNTYSYSLPSNGSLNPTTWTAPAGWTVTPTNGTASAINVSIPDNAIGGAYVLTAKSNFCDGATNLTVNVRAATPAFTATTPNCVVRGTASTTSIAVVPIAGVTNYSWAYPAGVTCTNCTTANPTFVLNSAGTSAIITATAIGAGGCNSTSVSKTILYAAVATNFPGNGFNDQYVVNNTCGAVASWVIGTTVPPTSTTYTATSGNIVINSSNGGINNALTLWGSSGAAVTSVCANLSGGGQICATAFGANTQRHSESASDASAKAGIKNVMITPNPNSGNFNIEVVDFNENASATLADFSGNEIRTFLLRKGENKIENEGLKKGTYFIILNIDGKQETRQIVIK